jgi:hypothetical protein
MKMNKKLSADKNKLFLHLGDIDEKQLDIGDQPGIVYGTLEEEVRKFNKTNGTNFDPVSVVEEYLSLTQDDKYLLRKPK